MKTNLVVLRPSDTLGKAASLILRHHYRNLPVVDEAGRYLGVVSSNCLLRLVLPRAATMEEGLEHLPFVNDTVEDLRERWQEALDHSVRECLDTSVETVAPDTPLTETLLALYHNRTSLPVVERESGRLVGLVSHWSVGRQVMGEPE
jgi:CBS domain-containing protein